MDLNKLLQNKAVVFGVIGGLVLLVAILLMMVLTKGNGGTQGEQIKAEPKIHETFKIITVEDPGRALEIESLLAREGVHIDREAGEQSGSKITLILKDYTQSEKDRAILAIVRSGLADKNIGLEIFDKGDFMSSNQDKKIRLARATNGELARLIKRLDNVLDASVFVSIPDQTIFAIDKKPTTATVQVTLSPDKKLDRDQVRTVTNLLLGSIPDLNNENISITDTSGHVYHSVISPEDDMMDIREENDNYMKTKVESQLDRLVGKGNYVVTVSTFLRQAPLESSKVIYNPKESSVMNVQKFSESLGDKSRDKNKFSSAVSTYIPGGLPQSPDSSANRNYNRSAAELSYGVGKTQLQEYKKPGMIEEISIAVTMDRSAVPPDMSMDQFKELIARSASPKVNSSNVEIAFSESNSPLLSPEKEAHDPKPEDSGNPWWTVAALLGCALLVGLGYISNKAKEHSSKQQRDIEALIERTEVQQNMIREAQAKAAMVQEKQQELEHTITAAPSPAPVMTTLKQTIDDIRENIDDEDDAELASQLKSWIESN